MPPPIDAAPQGPAGCPVSGPDVDAWFVREILPLEPALMRMLRRHWRKSDEQADIRQDIYVRVYESVSRDGLPESAAGFLFTCARHLLIDRVRRDRVVSFDIMADLEDMQDSRGHDLTPERLAGAREEWRLFAAALDQLPPRCREVLKLRKVDGLSQRDIAAQLGIAEGTVEKQVTLGVRMVAETLLGQGVQAAGSWIQRLRARRKDE
jgi:RNA polymerase sigma-70 factor (ECF subfamily)